MHRFHVKRLGAAGAVAAASLGSLMAAGPALAAGTPPSSATVTTRVVASHLNTPKYLTFGRVGLYVAISGSGGRRCVNAIGTTGAPTPVCEGPTGSVLRIDRTGHATTVLRDLASSVQKSNGEVEGPIAVTFDGRRTVALERGAYVGPTGRSALPGVLGLEFGKLIAATPRRVSERLDVLADFGRFAERNPQSGAMLGGLPGEITNDTDAHDVVAYRGGWAVADAGANDVIWVHRGGRMSLIARLPTETETAPAGALGPGSPAMTIQAQSVPSSLTVGPDGALYVGVLRGIPSLPGTAQVFRVVPGQAPVAVVTGLSRVSDVAFEKSGKLLILESSAAGGSTTPTSAGALLQATLDGTTTVQATNTGLTGLVDPTGLAVGPAGGVYITNDTGTLGQGEVLQVSGLQ